MFSSGSISRRGARRWSKVSMLFEVVGALVIGFTFDVNIMVQRGGVRRSSSSRFSFTQVHRGWIYFGRKHRGGEHFGQMHYGWKHRRWLCCLWFHHGWFVSLEHKINLCIHRLKLPKLINDNIKLTLMRFDEFVGVKRNCCILWICKVWTCESWTCSLWKWMSWIVDLWIGETYKDKQILL